MHVQSVQKMLFFIVKYENLWGFCCRRRRGCLKLSIVGHFCRNYILQCTLHMSWSWRMHICCFQDLLRPRKSFDLSYEIHTPTKRIFPITFGLIMGTITILTIRLQRQRLGVKAFMPILILLTV